MPRHKPYVFKPEMVRGCTMRCQFCALRHTAWAEEKYEYIDLDLWCQFCDAVADWCPKSRFEIANRGEQTLHPAFLKMISYARRALPKVQIMVSTNGDLVCGMKDPSEFRAWVEEALHLGVNIFLLDCYTPSRLRLFTELFFGMHNLFFDDSYVPYRYRSPKLKVVCIKDATFDRRTVKENKILQYHNQGGNAWLKPREANPWGIELLQLAPQRMCTRPFRELPMWFDGSIPICCDDWNDEAIVASFPRQSLQECWDSYDLYRRDLVKKRRLKRPCNRCSERSGPSCGLEMGWFGGD